MVFYPAIFTQENEGYSVTFPNLPGCQTQGDTTEEAITMSQEALGLYLVSLEERKLPIPAPANPLSVDAPANGFITLITVNLNDYRRNKAIKKTLTIPQWLNDEAEARNINFSKTLQQALTEKLNV